MTLKNKFRTKIEEVQYLKTGAFFNLFGRYENHVFEDVDTNFLFTGSGRAALRLILEFYTMNKTLTDKNSQILVPRWLCYSALNSMQKFCMPALMMNKGIRGVLVYHQYGYPQKMGEISDFCKEKDLFIIEDCANVFESYYRGKRVGTFGDAAIFSFSKLFPSLLGGALMTGNKDLFNFSQTRLLLCKTKISCRKLSFSTYFDRFLYECFRDTILSESVHKLQEKSYGIIDHAYTIMDISLRIVNGQVKSGTWEQRKKNYNVILEYFSDQPEYFGDLEREGVIPYVVPLIDKEVNLKRMVDALYAHNVMTGIYHFDVNRNLLDPDYKKCLWIPVHQGINSESMERICEIIKKA